MRDERRINIRVSREDFDKLDQKRFNEKTSWQAIGYSCLMSWLGGTKGTTRETSANARDTIRTNETEIHEKLDYILEYSAPEVANFIRGDIEVFARDTRREQAHAADSDQVPAASNTGRNKRPDSDVPTPRRTRTPAKRKGAPTPISTSGRRRR